MPKEKRNSAKCETAIILAEERESEYSAFGIVFKVTGSGLVESSLHRCGA